MGREKHYESPHARIPGKITSFLERGKMRAERQRLERQPVRIDAIPQDQEIVLMVQPGFRECADTRAFSKPVFSPPPSRIDPSS